MLEQRIEEAAMNAWPSLKQILFDGWILRFAKGFTKRANSVNVLHDGTMDLEQKVGQCEEFYRSNGLPPIFRLTSISAPKGLDDLLGSRGYQTIDRSDVMYADLTAQQLRDDTASLREEEIDAWTALFCELRGMPKEDQAVHKEMLTCIAPSRRLVSLVESGRVVACSLAVLDDVFCGLFDVITDPDQRRKGYALRMLQSVLTTAVANGAKHAYVQVVSDNHAAKQLYARLGFRDLYHYWYRV